MIRMQGNFVFITTARHYDEPNKRFNHQHSSSVYDECDGPKKRKTICLKVRYIFLVNAKVVYIALYLIVADFLLINKAT